METLCSLPSAQASSHTNCTHLCIIVGSNDCQLSVRTGHLIGAARSPAAHSRVLHSTWILLRCPGSGAVPHACAAAAQGTGEEPCRILPRGQCFLVGCDRGAQQQLARPAQRRLRSRSAGITTENLVYFTLLLLIGL